MKGTLIGTATICITAALLVACAAEGPSAEVSTSTPAESRTDAFGENVATTWRSSDGLETRLVDRDGSVVLSLSRPNGSDTFTWSMLGKTGQQRMIGQTDPELNDVNTTAAIIYGNREVLALGKKTMPQHACNLPCGQGDCDGMPSKNWYMVDGGCMAVVECCPKTEN